MEVFAYRILTSVAVNALSSPWLLWQPSSGPSESLELQLQNLASTDALFYVHIIESFLQSVKTPPPSIALCISGIETLLHQIKTEHVLLKNRQKYNMGLWVFRSLRKYKCDYTTIIKLQETLLERFELLLKLLQVYPPKKHLSG